MYALNVISACKTWFETNQGMCNTATAKSELMCMLAWPFSLSPDQIGTAKVVGHWPDVP
jgi:hypothetical protein